MPRVKELGIYRVLTPMLPRHKSRKYLDLRAIDQYEAIEKMMRIVEERYQTYWFLDGDFEVIKVWQETTYYTDEEVEASNERTKDLKAKFAAIRAEKSKRS